MKTKITRAEVKGLAEGNDSKAERIRKQKRNTELLWAMARAGMHSEAQIEARIKRDGYPEAL